MYLIYILFIVIYINIFIMLIMSFLLKKRKTLLALKFDFNIIITRQVTSACPSDNDFFFYEFRAIFRLHCFALTNVSIYLAQQ